MTAGALTLSNAETELARWIEKHNRSRVRADLLTAEVRSLKRAVNLWTAAAAAREAALAVQRGQIDELKLRITWLEGILHSIVLTGWPVASGERAQMSLAGQLRGLAAEGLDSDKYAAWFDSRSEAAS